MWEREHKVSPSVEQYIGSYSKLNLLCFLAEHPNTKFNTGAMGCAVPNVRSIELQQMVLSLEKEGLLERCSTNGTALYRLTTETEKRALVTRLLGHSRHKLQQCLGFPGNHRGVEGQAKEILNPLN